MTGRPHTLLAAIDDLLFEPDGWFAIDRTNRRVPRVVIPTRQAGLALVGRGPVATIVGRLRPEAVAIDIDLDDGRGTRAADQLTAWCDQHGLWCAVRPSGRPGHWHVIDRPTAAVLDELQALVSEPATSARSQPQTDRPAPNAAAADSPAPTRRDTSRDTSALAPRPSASAADERPGRRAGSRTVRLGRRATKQDERGARPASTAR